MGQYYIFQDPSVMCMCVIAKGTAKSEPETEKQHQTVNPQRGKDSKEYNPQGIKLGERELPASSLGHSRALSH